MPATVNRAALAAARQRLAQAPRDVLCAVAADLVGNTPVKAGFLRAAWTVAADGVPLDGAPAEPDPSGSATVDRLQAEIRATPDAATIGFRNLAPYAAFVEYGTSEMAPRAFMRGTLARVPVIAAAVIGRGPGGSL